MATSSAAPPGWPRRSSRRPGRWTTQYSYCASALTAGNQHAAWQLVDLLEKRGDLDGLRTRANAGNQHAAERLPDLLADLLMKKGRSEEAERLRRFGLNPDRSIACV